MKEIEQSVTVTVKRSQINLNPYNPKNHTDDEVKVQKDNIRRVGILGGLTWNMETGNLLDGHRRVKALDLLHHYDGTDKTDYDIKVEKVEFDEVTEKEQMTYMAMGNSKVDFNLVAQYIDDVEYEHLGIGMDDYNAILELRDFDDDVPMIEMEMPKGIAGLREEFGERTQTDTNGHENSENRKETAENRKEPPHFADGENEKSESAERKSESESERFYSNNDDVIDPNKRVIPRTVNEMTEAELLGEGVSKSASQPEEDDDAEIKKNITKINKEYTQDVAERRTAPLSLIGAIRFADEDEKEEFCKLFGIPFEFNIDINARDILDKTNN